MKAFPNEFPSSELNSVGSVWPLFLTGSAFIIGLLEFLTGGRVVGSTPISVFLLPFLPLFVLIRLTSKIRFHDDYVEKITIFGRRRIKLDSVKSFGVWIQYGRFVPMIVDPKEVDEYSMLASNVIFISTIERIKPLRVNNNETITFQYRKDVYDYVETVLGQYCQQSKPDTMRR